MNLILTMLLGGLWHGASWAFIVWGALHGFGLAVTRYFQRSTRDHGRMIAICGVLAVAGVAGVVLAPSAVAAIGLFVFHGDVDNPTHATWALLVVLWVTVTPFWAVATAWLGDAARKPEPVIEPVPFRALIEGPFYGRGMIPANAMLVECLRFAMCVVAIAFLASLHYLESWTWIPMVLVMWGLGIAADIVERGFANWEDRLVLVLRRAVAVVLVFHYVCLAWVFFRASSFDGALDVLRQIADGSTDHPNLVAIVTTALVVGFVCHFFADGSFRWLRRRWVELPPIGQAVVLVAVVFVLRALAHHEIVPFIYFQF
jgi:hypothetical protein